MSVSARRRLRPQIHDEQVGIAALLQAHDDTLAIRRETRRERHAREVADDLALACLDIEEIDLGITLAEFHIGDLLRRRREPRRQHQIRPARQVTHIGTVLIHQRQSLDAALLGARFVNEDHAAIEIALLAGQALIDLVGNDVGDTTPVFRRGEILLASQLLTGGDVPQPEFGLQATIALPGHAASRPAPAH